MRKIKLTYFFLFLWLAPLLVACKKESFEHKAIDFAFADDIAGTYYGTRFRENVMWWGAPPGTINHYDSVTVIVEDRREGNLCKFYISYFDEEFIVKPDGIFINIKEGMHSRSYGYLKNNKLYFEREIKFGKALQNSYYELKLTLNKQ